MKQAADHHYVDVILLQTVDIAKQAAAHHYVDVSFTIHCLTRMTSLLTLNYTSLI